MNMNLLGRLLLVGSFAVFAACQPAEPVVAEGSAATGEMAEAEGSAAPEAAAEEEGSAAPEAAAEEGTAAPAVVAEATPGTPVAAATAELLHGTWRVDMAAALEAQGSGMSPEERAMMQALMGSMQITFTFNADGTAAMSASGMGQEEVKSGAWAAGAVDGTAITFTLTENGEDGTPGEVQTFTASFMDSNNITLSKEGEADTMPLVRVN
jgi:hypothetical protein